MKKIIILALCFMFMFSACSSKEPADVTTETTAAVVESIPENYVGDATVETIKTLVNMHIIFETEYLEKAHPTVDMTKTIEQNGRILAPVAGGIFKNYKEYETAIRDTYTAECADFILNSNCVYVNVDDALYFDTTFEPKFENPRYNYNWSNYRIETVDVSDTKIIFNVFIKYSSGDDAAIMMTALLEDGNWRIVR